MLSITHIISIILTLLLTTCVGLYSIRKVKSASDFTVGGRAVGVSLITGAIVGTLVGGASTVGTAQLAFKYGLSAWWFTLGAGIACIALGIFLAKPLRESGVSTGPGYLASFYGEKAGVGACIFSSIGILLSFIGQILSAVALLTSMFNMSPFLAACIAVFLVIAYVAFGGVWGTGLVGILKVFLLYMSMLAVGILAFDMGGGLSGFTEKFPFDPWFNIFGRGVSTDLAAGFSLLVGVLSTQTYLQVMFSGKTVNVSRRGAITSGLIIPPVGLAGVFVGLFMRANFPHINSKQALPVFILQFLPDWLGGVVLATLLISVVGTAAGLILGVSTMFCQDIYKKLLRPGASSKSILTMSRLLIIVVSGMMLLFVRGNIDSLILKWVFLSMGLRGATICLPLLSIIFLRRVINPYMGVWAVFIAPLSVILWASFKPFNLDPLYIGLCISFAVLTFGSLASYFLKLTSSIQFKANERRLRQDAVAKVVRAHSAFGWMYTKVGLRVLGLCIGGVISLGIGLLIGLRWRVPMIPNQKGHLETQTLTPTAPILSKQQKKLTELGATHEGTQEKRHTLTNAFSQFPQPIGMLKDALVCFVAGPTPGLSTRPLAHVTPLEPDPVTEAWRIVKDATDPQDLIDFLSTYPRNRFAFAARMRIRQLQRQRRIANPPKKPAEAQGQPDDAQQREASISSFSQASWSKMRQAQIRLQEMGFNPGPIDGIFGPRTQAVLRRYQAGHGLAVTGMLDAATWKALGIPNTGSR